MEKNLNVVNIPSSSCLILSVKHLGQCYSIARIFIVFNTHCTKSGKNKPSVNCEYVLLLPGFVWYIALGHQVQGCPETLHCLDSMLEAILLSPHPRIQIKM